MSIAQPLAAMRGPDRPLPEVVAVAPEPCQGAPLDEALAAAKAVAERRMRLLHADVERIAEAAGYSIADVRDSTRSADLVEVRRIIVRYLRAQDPPVSFPVIGRVINRDHTSAMHLLSPRRVAG